MKAHRLKPPKAKKGEVNHGLVDRFTLAHFGIGVSYAYLGLGWELVLFLALAWELIENPLKRNLPFIFPHATADTLQNAIGDTVAVCLGWGLAHYISLA